MLDRQTCRQTCRQTDRQTDGRTDRDGQQMALTTQCFHFTDPYAKVSLFIDGKRVDKKKTTVTPGTRHPVWNESFQFTVPMDTLERASLIVRVMHSDKLGRNRGIGKVEVGPTCKATSLGAQHWHNVTASPRRQVAQWHPLTK